MSIRISFSADDLHYSELLERLMYFREYMVGLINPLEKALDRLNGFPPNSDLQGFPDYSQSRWEVEEHRRIQAWITEIQKFLELTETEIRKMGREIP